MIKKIFIYIGIILGVVLVLSIIGIAIVYSNYKKLASVEIESNFETDTIPFTYSNSGHILIDVKVQGSEKVYPFIVDSGASNMLFGNNSAELDAENTSFGIGRGSSGNYFFTKIKKIDSLKFGSTSFKNVSFKETDHNFDCTEKIYGLIGTGLMHNFIWQIDFENKLIILAKSINDFEFNKNRLEFNLRQNQFSHHLSIPLKLSKQSSTIAASIDLGNSGNLSIDEYEILNDSLKFPSRKIIGSRVSGLGDSRTAVSRDKIYLIDTLSLQSRYAVYNIPISAKPGGLSLLGLGFFSKFRTTLDWNNNKLILEPYATEQDYRFDTFGFGISYDGNLSSIAINYIIENSPAEKENLKQKSKVFSLNGIESKGNENLCEFKKVMSNTDSIALVLEVDGKLVEHHLIRKGVFD